MFFQHLTDAWRVAKEFSLISGYNKPATHIKNVKVRVKIGWEWNGMRLPPTRIVKPTTSLAPRWCEKCPLGDKQTIPAQSQYWVKRRAVTACQWECAFFHNQHIQKDSKKKNSTLCIWWHFFFRKSDNDCVLSLARIKCSNIQWKFNIVVRRGMQASRSIKEATAASNSSFVPPPKKI